jgi:hypothetical protein
LGCRGEEKSMWISCLGNCVGLTLFTRLKNIVGGARLERTSVNMLVFIILKYSDKKPKMKLDKIKYRTQSRGEGKNRDIYSQDYLYTQNKMNIHLCDLSDSVT